MGNLVLSLDSWVAVITGRDAIEREDNFGPDWLERRLCSCPKFYQHPSQNRRHWRHQVKFLTSIMLLTLFLFFPTLLRTSHPFDKIPQSNLNILSEDCQSLSTFILSTSKLIPDSFFSSQSTPLMLAASVVHVQLTVWPFLSSVIAMCLVQPLKELVTSQKPHVCTLRSCRIVFAEGPLQCVWSQLWTLHFPSSAPTPNWDQSSVMPTCFISFPLSGSMQESPACNLSPLFLAAHPVSNH